ncbi:tetratricopeptide repeat-containing sensor histidine kinase [Spirosoma gilvum]
MKRFCLFLLLWTFSIAVTTAQSSRTVSVDSLKRLLALPKQDTSRVLVLLRLGAELLYTNPDSAMNYGQQALSLARQLKFYRGESRASMGVGYLFRETGNLPKALEVNLKALRIAQDHQFQLEIAMCTQRIGGIYYDLKDYAKAIQYYKQSERIADVIHDESLIAVQQNNLGAAYLYANQLDSAEQYLQSAYHNSIRLKLDRHLSYIRRNLGMLHQQLGHNDRALSYYKQSAQYALQINDLRNAAFAYNHISGFYLKLNQADSAVVYARKALAQAGSFTLQVLEASRLLAAAYKQKQDYRQALAYHELMLKTKEKLFGAGSIQAMQAIVANEEKRQREIEQAKAAYQTQIRQYGLLAGLAVVLLIAFIMYRTNRQQQKDNRLLRQQKEEIDHQRHKAETAFTELKVTQAQLIQKEKMASLGELTAGIAHEIQNPLNFVNNFSELSAELVSELTDELDLGDTQEAKVIAGNLSQNLQKITHHGQRASGIVKGMLEHSRTSSGQKELTDLNALAAEYLKLAYQGFRRSGDPAKDNQFNCELVTTFDPNLPNVEIAAQEIGRVLLNLYNNAFYAIGQRARGIGHGVDYQPTIWVSTLLRPLLAGEGRGERFDASIEIRVKDNGMGIPDSIKAKIFQPFFTTKPTGEGTGLGLSLSYDIVTKGHGGTLSVTTEPGAFTEFNILLPL